MVRLANIDFEGAFRLGEVLVTPMHSLPFESFGDGAIRDHPDRSDDVRAVRAELRRDLRHLTGVQIEVVGDLEFARERARAVAFDMGDVLRLMSPAAPTWNIAFPCLPHGCEHQPSATVLEIRGGNLGTISSGLLDPGTFRWKVTLAEIDELMKAGFQGCAAFFSSRELTGSERRVKTAVSAHSRGIASHDQLLYAMSAAEHLLLRDVSRPIRRAWAPLGVPHPDGRRRAAACRRELQEGLRT